MRFCADLPDELRQHLELYALGALAADESAELERHLGDCPTCCRALDELRGAAEEMVFAASPAEPPAALRARLLAGLLPRGCHLLRRHEGDWSATGIAGVDLRLLYADPDQDRQTILLRMAPAAVFPLHLHHGAEECLVLEGDVRDGDLEMKAGDYVRFAAGTRHGPLQTRGGNLLLIVSSLHDEIVD